MSFDPIAPVYDALSRLVFGRSLVQAQLVWLTKVPPDSAVLIVGGGTGGLLAEVLTQCRPARVLFLEASGKMLTKARGRVRHHPLTERVEFREGTESLLQASDAFTVVLLPFVLDVSPEPVLARQFLPPLLRATLPGGLWLVTDFIHSPRLQHRLLLQTMYFFFRLVTGLQARQLPDWPRLLTEAGLIPGAQQTAANGQVQTGVWYTKAL